MEKLHEKLGPLTCLPLPPMCLPPMQMEEHEEALTLLVRKLGDYKGAKNYCATYSQVHMYAQSMHCATSKLCACCTWKNELNPPPP